MSPALGVGLGGDAGGSVDPLRFSDVIGELHKIADLAQSLDDAGGSEIAAACFRAESLITRLRNQFIENLLALDGALETSIA